MRFDKLAAVVAVAAALSIVLLARRRLATLEERAYIRRLIVTHFAILVFVACANVLVVPEAHRLDIDEYREYAGRVLAGERPYADFQFEYPPLALAPMIIPAAVIFGASDNVRYYALLFGIQIAFVSCAVAFGVEHLACWDNKNLRSAVRSYLLLVAVMLPLLSWRFDVVPAWLTQLALVSLVHRRPTAAGVFLGAAIAAKLYPLLLVPVFVVYYLARRQPVAGMRVAFGALFSSAVFFAPAVWTAGTHVTNFLEYQHTRGLQLESIPAGVLLMRGIVTSAPVSLGFNFGAYHVVSPAAESIVRLLPTVALVAFALTVSLAFVQFRTEHDDSGSVAAHTVIRFVVATLLVALSTSKVFSPQYVIWLIPFAPLLGARAQAVVFVITALTIAIFPFLYIALREQHLLAVLVLNARNVLVIATGAYLLVSRDR